MLGASLCEDVWCEVFLSWFLVFWFLFKSMRFSFWGAMRGICIVGMCSKRGYDMLVFAFLFGCFWIKMIFKCLFLCMFVGMCGAFEGGPGFNVYVSIV
jgi:hypothetical protein